MNASLCSHVVKISLVKFTRWPSSPYRRASLHPILVNLILVLMSKVAIKSRQRIWNPYLRKKRRKYRRVMALGPDHTPKTHSGCVPDVFLHTVHHTMCIFDAISKCSSRFFSSFLFSQGFCCCNAFWCVFDVFGSRVSVQRKCSMVQFY